MTHAIKAENRSIEWAKTATFHELRDVIVREPHHRSHEYIYLELAWRLVKAEECGLVTRADIDAMGAHTHTLDEAQAACPGRGLYGCSMA